MSAFKTEIDSTNLFDEITEEASTSSDKSVIQSTIAEPLQRIMINLYDLTQCLDDQRAKDNEKLQSDSVRLMVGQLAFRLEETIVKKVLPTRLPSGHYVYNIKTLQKVLQQKSPYTDALADETERREANESYRKHCNCESITSRL